MWAIVHANEHYPSYLRVLLIIQGRSTGPAGQAMAGLVFGESFPFFSH